MKSLVLIFLGLWCFAQLSYAKGNAVYVSTEGSDNSDGSEDHPYGSFRAALANIVDTGTHILAFGGTYKGSDNYDLQIDSSLSIAFGIADAVGVEIDFEGTTYGFLASSSVTCAVQNYKFQNQAANSTTPILSFDSCEEVLISDCHFENVAFAVSMVEVTEAFAISGSTFDSCSSKNQDGPALFCQDSIGSITDTIFQNNHGANGGSIYIDSTPSGSISLDDVQILDSIAEKAGGGLYVATGNVAVQMSSFRGNTAMAGSGGAVYSGAPISISSSELEENTASSVGGAIALESSPTSDASVAHSSSLSSLQVNENTATLGGGIHLSSLSPVFLSSSSLLLNNATVSEDEEVGSGLGGGLYVDTTSDVVTIDQTSFLENVAATSGGGVYIAGPSGSSMVQMRSGCVVKDNAAGVSGGGVELGSTVLFASFVGVSVSDNTVESGPGGGFMLRASCVISSSTIDGNSADTGAGVEIDHAGLVSLIDNMISENDAASIGGGIRVTPSSALLLSGGEISGNTATQGGGAYIAPSLPVEFSSASFVNNVAGAGGSLYLAGSSQESLDGLNLVRMRACSISDENNNAIYSNGGEIVLLETCSVPGLQVVAESSVSFCSCPANAAVSGLQLQADSGTFLTDTPLQLSGNFRWYGGEIYGVNSSTCLTGLKAGFDASDDSLDSPVSVEVLGNGVVGSNGGPSLESKEIEWVVSHSLTMSTDKWTVTGGKIAVYPDGRLSLPKSGKLNCGTVENKGTLQLEKGTKILGTVIQSGTMEIRYSSIPQDRNNLASVSYEENLGGEIIVHAPSPTPLSKGDSFDVLAWDGHTGFFRSFELVSSVEDNAHPVLDYKAETLACVLVHSGTSNGGLIAVIVVSILIIIAFVGGCYVTLRMKDKWGGEEEVWDDGAEESKILGESGVVVEGREEQSLITNADL